MIESFAEFGNTTLHRLKPGNKKDTIRQTFCGKSADMAKKAKITPTFLEKFSRCPDCRRLFREQYRK